MDSSQEPSGLVVTRVFIGRLGSGRQVTTKPYKSFQNIKYQQFLKALQTPFSININGGVAVIFRHV